jgi:DNA-binding transcriptional LysR family regulator
MTSSSPPWDLYRSFLAVMNNGTLTGAATRLGMSQPVDFRRNLTQDFR